jgi:hypothetical protein
MLNYSFSSFYEYLEHKRNNPEPKMVELPKTQVKELVELPQMIQVLKQEHYGQREIRILEQLYTIQQNNPSNMAVHINQLLPALDITKDYYEDLETGKKGCNFDLIQKLDTLALNTGNHMIQRFVAQYNAACYVYTCKKHKLPIIKATMNKIYSNIMKRYGHD